MVVSRFCVRFSDNFAVDDRDVDTQEGIKFRKPKKRSAFPNIGSLNIIYSFLCLIRLAFSHLPFKNYC